MKPAECRPGTPVVYRPHPGAPAEDGDVIRRSTGDLVFVLFVGDRHPKAVSASQLERP